MTFVQDFRYALRSMRKNPGFVIVAAVTLALGIGFNTGLFTLFNALALRPLPVRDPARVVNISWKDPQGHIAPRLSNPDYIDFRDRNHSFEGMLAYCPTEMIAGAGRDGRPEKAMSYLVSANYFPVLGATFARGRSFTEDEGSK